MDSTPETVVPARPPPKPNREKTVCPTDTDFARSDRRQQPENIPQGKHTSLMQPQPLAGVHPFEPTLRRWAHGIPVDCGPDWAWPVIEAAVERGPHPTARTPDSIRLFKEDIEYQIKAGFCRVFLWDDIVRMRPKNLKISPVAVERFQLRQADMTAPLQRARRRCRAAALPAAGDRCLPPGLRPGFAARVVGCAGAWPPRPGLWPIDSMMDEQVLHER